MKFLLSLSLLLLSLASVSQAADPLPKTLKCRIDTTEFSKQLNADKDDAELFSTIIETVSDDKQYAVRVDAWQPREGSKLKRNILIGVTDKKTGAQFFSGSYLPGRVLTDVDFASAQVMRDQKGSAGLVAECKLQ